MSISRRIIKEKTNKDLKRITVTVPPKKAYEKVTNLAAETYELGDLLVSYLEQLGVEYVFGIPGGPIEPLYNALARSERRGGPRAVIARHESGAAFMADGYARNTGKLGVCCATAGPGSTNIITGIASAFDNHSPLLVITGQTSISNFGKGATQESGDTGINSVAMFSHCTRYSSLVSHVDQFEQKLVSAVVAASNVPYGPSHLSVPVDVMRCESPIKKPSFNLKKLMWQTPLADIEQIKEVSQLLVKNKNIVLLVGEGVEPAVSSLLKIAFKINATIVTTPHGKGLISPYHPLYRGVVGFAGHNTASEALASAEIVVAAGTPLQEFATNGWSVVNEIGERLIHIDESEIYFSRSPMARMHVKGNIKKTLENIYEQLNILKIIDSQEDERGGCNTLSVQKSKPEKTWPKLNFSLDNEEKMHARTGLLKPQRVMYLLPKIFPPKTRFLCDAGNCIAWTIHYLHPEDRRIRDRRDMLRPVADNNIHANIDGRRETRGSVFWTPLECSSMGWSIGSAIGTSIACPKSPTVAIVGDGAMLMNGGDVSVAVQEMLNIIYVVLNDSEFGMVKQGQLMAGAEKTAYKLPQTDFVKWGESLGAGGYAIHSSRDLEKLDISKILNANGPIILDVYIDKDEVPPMKSRLQALGSV